MLSKKVTGVFTKNLLLDSVDSQPGDGVVGSVGLHLADSLQATHVAVDVHVGERGVNNVNAGMNIN